MLSVTGNLPTANTVSLDHLAGSGSSLPFSDNDQRLNTLDRNVERLKNFNPDEVKGNAEKELR